MGEIMDQVLQEFEAEAHVEVPAANSPLLDIAVCNERVAYELVSTLVRTDRELLTLRRCCKG